jgi:N-acetylglucosamine kinase-like BadF-type ATPase
VNRLYLGVDGGKSSTTALIGDSSGRVIGYGRGGPSNHVQEAEAGRVKFIRAIKECLVQACQQAHLDYQTVRFQAACLGFSGGPVDKEPILREVLRCDRMTVTHDALIALSGATNGEPGVVVIAGTGSIAFGRNATGHTARAGGWGYIFGDEGSGFDITRQALRAALRFEEGWGPSTVLHEALLYDSNASDANEALHNFYTIDFPRDRIAAMSKLVDKAASAGDPVAAQILDAAAQQLAALVWAVRDQLFPPTESPRISYAGGVFQSTRVLDRFRFIVDAHPPVYGPAAGALLEAYRAAQVHVSLAGVPEVEKQ